MANLGDLRKIVYKTIEDKKTGLSASQVRIATFSDVEFAGTFYVSIVTSESSNNDYTFAVDLASKSNVAKYSLRNATRTNDNKFGIYVDGSNSVFIRSVGTNIVDISVRKEIKYGVLLETSSLSVPSPLLDEMLFENLDMSSSNLFKTLFVENLEVNSITGEDGLISIDSNVDSSLSTISLFPTVEEIIIGGNGEPGTGTVLSDTTIPGNLQVQGTITFADDQVYDKINIVGEFGNGFFPFRVIYGNPALIDPENPSVITGDTIFYINHDGDTRVEGNLDVNGQTTNLLNTNIVGNAIISSGYLQANNIKIDLNTISSTDTNGNITLDPNGSGVIELLAPTSADSLSVGGTATIGSTLGVSGNTTIGSGTNASLSVVGSISTSSKLTVADTTIVSNDVTLLQSSDLRIIKGGSRYFNEDINTLFTWNGMVWVGVVLPTSEPVPPNEGDRYFNETSNTLFTYSNGSWSGEVLPTLTQAPTTSVDINGDSGDIQTIGDISILGDIAVNGGYITTNQTTASIFDATATTVDAFGAATVLNLGHDGTSTSTTNIATGVIGSNNTKTVNLGTSADAGGSTLVNIGASGAGAVNSIVNIYGTLNVSGKVNTINTEEINISDNKIILNSDLNDTPGSGWFGGIEIKTGETTSKTLLWDHGESRWEIDGSPIATKDLTLAQFAPTTSAQLAGVISNDTGYDATQGGSLVFSYNPTFSFPTLGVAAATSINKVEITAPATGATLTIANGKTLTANKIITLDGADNKTLNLNKTITLEADQDSRTVNFGAGTTSAFRVAYSSDNLGLFALTTSAQLAGIMSDKTGYTSGAKLMFSDSPEVTNLQVGEGAQIWEFDATSANNFIIKSGASGSQINPLTLSSSGALATLGTISSPSLVSTSIGASVITLTSHQGSSPSAAIRAITADSAGNLYVGNGSFVNQITTLGNLTNGTGSIVRTTDATFTTHPVGTRDNKIATTNFVGNELEWSLFGYTTTNITTADFDITAGSSGNLFISSSTRSDQFDIENFDYKFVYFGSANSEVSSTNVDINTANVIKLRLNDLAERKRYAWISQRIVRGSAGTEGNFEDTFGTTGEFDSDFSNAIGTLVTLDDVSSVPSATVGVTYIKMEFVVSESYANSNDFNSGVIMVEGEGSAIFSTTNTTDASWQGTKSGSSKAWFTGTVKGITSLTVLNFRNTVGAATSSIKVQKVQVYKRRRIR